MYDHVYAEKTTTAGRRMTMAAWVGAVAEAEGTRQAIKTVWTGGRRHESRSDQQEGHQPDGRVGLLQGLPPMAGRREGVDKGTKIREDSKMAATGVGARAGAGAGVGV